MDASCAAAAAAGAAAGFASHLAFDGLMLVGAMVFGWFGRGFLKNKTQVTVVHANCEHGSHNHGSKR